ncbi:MAG: hypothetical protein N2067_05630 [Spirochaetaceae bacterium]|nr:hypothetical protein [Spirochaetaceae bacterium]
MFLLLIPILVGINLFGIYTSLFLLLQASTKWKKYRNFITTHDVSRATLYVSRQSYRKASDLSTRIRTNQRTVALLRSQLEQSLHTQEEGSTVKDLPALINQLKKENEELAGELKKLHAKRKENIRTIQNTLGSAIGFLLGSLLHAGAMLAIAKGRLGQHPVGIELELWDMLSYPFCVFYTKPHGQLVFLWGNYMITAAALVGGWLAGRVGVMVSTFGAELPGNGGEAEETKRIEESRVSLRGKNEDIRKYKRSSLSHNA